jgi:cytochrome c
VRGTNVAGATFFHETERQRQGRPAMTHITFVPSILSALTFIATITAARANTADPQMAFNNACRTCHSMKEGDNRLGPSLAGVVGRKAGSLPGFRYSSSMQSSGVTWDEATLDKFIANPDEVVHGNSMKPFTGIADAGQRKDIIGFLKSISGK